MGSRLDGKHMRSRPQTAIPLFSLSHGRSAEPHSKPIICPRPPQTRATPFKWLYRKRAGLDPATRLMAPSARFRYSPKTFQSESAFGTIGRLATTGGLGIRPVRAVQLPYRGSIHLCFPLMRRFQSPVLKCPLLHQGEKDRHEDKDVNGRSDHSADNRSSDRFHDVGTDS